MMNSWLMLCIAGASVNCVDNNHETALHSAAFYGHLKSAKFLVEKGEWNVSCCYSTF